MAPRLAELCELLVSDRFGRVAAVVFSTLARHGRLVLTQIQQHTAIPITRVRQTLLTLIASDILLWHQSDDSEPPHFQVDWHAAYVLVRQSRLLHLVEARQGKAARHLLHGILQRGKVQVGELEDEQHFELGSPRDSGIDMTEEHGTEAAAFDGTASLNGLSCKTLGEDRITSMASLHDTIRSLLADGFLSKVGTRDHVPAAELEEELRVEVIASNPKDFKDGKTTGPKTAVTFERAANDLKRKWQDDAEYTPQSDVASKGTIKRAKNATSGSNKQRKVNGDLTNGYLNVHNDEGGDKFEVEGNESAVQKLPSDMCIRVNNHKCMIALRTARLEKLADQYFGPTTAAVYGALLRAAEGKALSIRSQLRVKGGFSVDEGGEAVDNADITVADAEILDRLQRDLDLASAIKDPSGMTLNRLPDSTGKKPKKRRLVPDEDEDVAAIGVKKEVESDNEDDEVLANGVEPTERWQERSNHVSVHLELLGESSKKFLKRNSDKCTSSITFASLSNTIAEAEVDQMILSRSGQIGLRVVRVLREKGKLQDTQIATFCLKRLKDLRAVLTDLQSLGIIDVQELPRDQYRQPSRTVYLWHFDEQEVRRTFLQQFYHGLSRALLRMRVEKHRSRDIIEKAESVDWDMKRLNKPERDLWTRWHAVEERLTNTIERLDEAVMLLRDLDEADTSLLS